ncbi:MAG: CAP domain-containing protein [Myxococcota bacterium]|jgi:uncharacterized protein YkwD
MPRTIGQAIGFLLGMWIAIALSPLLVTAATSDSAFDHLEQELFAEVNRVRAQHHLIALSRRSDLDQVAAAHSVDMAQRGYFNHESPEGASPIDRIQTAGIDGMTLAAENLGLTRESDPTLAIVRSWLNSPDHRRNLLAPAMNSTGVGITRGKDGSLLYTQLYVSIPR